MQRLWYYPFGLQLQGIGRDEPAPAHLYRYNGKSWDPASGLSDYGARWYDAGSGRWSGVDPLAETMPSWSGYTYGFDNPIRFIDPDGRAPEDIYVFNSDGTFSGEVIEAPGEDVGLIRDYQGQGFDVEFTFADPENFPSLLVTPAQLEEIGLPFDENGQNYIDRVEIVGKFDIQGELMNAGVFDPNPGALVQLWTKSRGFDAPIDFSAKGSLLDRQSTLFLTENKNGEYVGHDFRNYGNFLWGATTKFWGIPNFIAKIGANTDALLNEGQLDTRDDQYSIQLGRQYAKQMQWKRRSF
ncbi:RHS repeat-associated core domain-containing protein [Phaeodactylibacter luteus]|uniref:RHS repeat-associated core domain-containing protein n=1 Tax=Phaeodactylibacter luteus TaxID=1564516 RepID=A0A5C6RJG6_9BACT|nr:RHS repeat-associated core domain-containing protein [Phaeodactylibacter luteus]TXB62074.1 RHS repeat-associated core domain-containing protein [Phaeodactylibacter luteus]